MNLGIYITKEPFELLGVPAGLLCWAPNNLEEHPFKCRKLIRAFDYDQPWKAIWVPRDSLLPVHQVGKEYRGDNGWFVVITGRFLKGRPNSFLQNPWASGDARLGNKPWRFGSRGEALYYLACFPFSTRIRVSVCNLSDNVYAQVPTDCFERRGRFPVLLPQVQGGEERQRMEIPNRQLLRQCRVRTTRLQHAGRRPKRGEGVS